MTAGKCNPINLEKGARRLLVSVPETIDSKSISEPCYYAVFAYSRGKGDWETVAIFTKEADAQLHLDWIKAGGSAAYEPAGCIQHLPMKTIIDLLVDERLGDVGKAIKQLSAVITGLIRDKVTS